MEFKPLIGVNAELRPEKGDNPAFSYIAAGYYRAISAVGGIPVVLPPLPDAQDLNPILDRLDGVMLIGGADLDPRLDGFMLHPTVRPLARTRENFDRALMDRIVQRRMPVFGIGVGMQLINVALGGNLFLHIPEDCPAAIPHKDPLDTAHRHGLEVEPDSIMERVYGDGEIRVNSMHHMAVDELAPGLRVTARCPDGIIECFESENRDDWFILGTQFHPEADSASALDLRIFEEFLLGVKGEEPVQIAAA